MNYKRQYREPSSETKQKISTALKNKPKSISHKQKKSQGLKAYWEKVPSRQDSDFTDSGRIV